MITVCTWYFIVPAGDLRDDMIKISDNTGLQTLRYSRADAPPREAIVKWTGPGPEIPDRFSPYIPRNRDQIFEELAKTKWKSDADLSWWDSTKIYTGMAG